MRGEASPMCIAVAGQMIGAEWRRIASQLLGGGQDRVCDVVRGGRVPPLIRYDGERVAVGGEPQHRLYEILSIDAVDPGRPKDQMARVRGSHRPFARQLGRAVDTDRRSGVVFPIGPFTPAGKNVVGRKMDDRRADPGCGRGHRAGASLVDCGSNLGLVLGLVDRGIGSGGDDDIRAGRLDRRMHARRVGKVEFRPSGSDDLEPRPTCGRLDQTADDLSLPAGNEYPHAVPVLATPSLSPA